MSWTASFLISTVYICATPTPSPPSPLLPSLLKRHLLQETIFQHLLKTASHKTFLILFLALVIFLCISFIVYLPRWMGFPCGLAAKESVCNAGDLGSIPGLGRSPGEGKGYPLQYSGLENSMDCIVHGVTKSPRWL